MAENTFSTVPRMRTIRGIPKFINNPIPALEQNFSEFGDTHYMYMGGIQKVLVTRDPITIKAVLQAQHRNFEKSDLQTKMVAEYLGKGLLTNFGADWLRQRRLIQPGFHKEKIEKLMELMMSVIHKFELKIKASTSAEFNDFGAEMMELAIEIIARTLISRAVPDSDIAKMSGIINRAQDFIIKQVRLPFLVPYFKWTGKIKEQKDDVNQMRKMLQFYVDERKSNGEKCDDLLDMLLDIRYEDNGAAMTNDQLIDEMLILFVAGHETTANALSWTWYLLCKNPQAVERIRAEADVFFNQNISLESLKNLSYTNNVVQESLRLYPPAWTTDRVALKDVDINGKKIKKGTMVIPLIRSVHRHPDFWENPDSFLPERFENEKAKSRVPFTFLPFGGGPRFCIGNNFSMIEMQLIVAYFCKQFDFELLSENEIGIKPMVTLRMDKKLNMRVTPRNK